MDRQPCIRCESLSKLYRQGEKTIFAVQNCNLKVYPGDFGAVIGKSGSGKSTLLNLIAGYTRPSQGTVYLGQKEICQMNDAQLAEVRRAGIGFVFQAYHLLPILTARENSLFACKDPARLSMSRRSCSQTSRRAIWTKSPPRR